MNNKLTKLYELFEVFEKNEAERIGNLNCLKSKIIYDGYVGTPEDFDKSERIMFIASEANDFNGCGEKSFWVKSMINKNNEHHRFITNINRIYKALMMSLYNKLDNETIINKLKNNNELLTNYDSLKNIAFINLKKTGGKGNIDAFETQIKDNISFLGWVDEHKKLLFDEISLINPKIIIVCGKKTQVAFRKITESYPLSDDITILYSYHPTSRFKAEKFINFFLVNNKKSLN